MGNRGAHPRFMFRVVNRGQLDPDWIQATGTWFGAVATVLTLLWAVRSFRSDQAEQEKNRRAEHQKDKAGQIAREQTEVNQAKNVSISLRAGMAFGSQPEQMMQSIHLWIKNHSKNGVSVHTITLDEQLKPKRPLPTFIFSRETTSAKRSRFMPFLCGKETLAVNR